MGDWAKASYGKTASKSGGGKLESVANGGNKGLPPGTSAPQSSVARVKGGIDTPTTKGNKGITDQKGFQSSKAPRD